MTVFLSVLSGILLTLSFPKSNFGFLAWISLVPLLFSLSSCEKRRQAIWYGFITGGVFFGTSLIWMNYVHFAAWVCLVPIQILFILLFAYFVYEGKRIPNAFLRSLWIAAAWTFTEWIRAEVPIFGLGWNLLAYSQSDYLTVIQSANLIGAFGLGFLIALCNAFVFQICSEGPKVKANVIAVVGLLIIGFSLYGFGYFQLQADQQSGKTLRFGVIQPNIAQELKWDPAAKQGILEIFQKQTELVSYEQPDLIIWPEAAFPGYFNRDRDTMVVRSLIQRLGIPLLLGSPHLREDNEAFNSAYLLDGQGDLVKRYDKRNLVPFGEYVPLQPIFGWLNPVAEALGVSDFLAGTEATVFHLPDSDVPISVLICFEDTFSQLARKFVQAGATALVVITNDAWFGPSSAPYQHVQASIFRAVENGVPVIRSANTGISALISKTGKVLGRIEDENGVPIFTAGYQTWSVDLTPKMTFYRVTGWVFPYILAFFFLGAFVLMKAKQKQKIKI